MLHVRPLAYLAVVTSGFHYRTRVTCDTAGEWRVAQGREVRVGLVWDEAGMPRVTPGPAERRARLQPGDVLVPARGERPYALIVPDWPWPALASSSFYRVRVRRDVVLPAYLAWYLNTPDALARLGAGMRGRKIKFLPRAALSALEVTLPPLARQAEIVAAAALTDEESRLHAELSAERREALAALVSGVESVKGSGTSRTSRIRLAEMQLEVVRERLARGFVRVGLA